MEWIDGLTYEARIALKSKWHTWFAWHPIVIGINDTGHRIILWLEYVKRKGEYHYTYDGSYWKWKYRKIIKVENELG